MTNDQSLPDFRADAQSRPFTVPALTIEARERIEKEIDRTMPPTMRTSAIDVGDDIYVVEAIVTDVVSVPDQAISVTDARDAVETEE